MSELINKYLHKILKKPDIDCLSVYSSKDSAQGYSGYKYASAALLN